MSRGVLLPLQPGPVPEFTTFVDKETFERGQTEMFEAAEALACFSSTKTTGETQTSATPLSYPPVGPIFSSAELQQHAALYGTGVSQETWDRYQKNTAEYEATCAAYDVPALPLSRKALEIFAIHQVLKKKLTPSSAANKLSGIRKVARVTRAGGVESGSIMSRSDDAMLAFLMHGLEKFGPCRKVPKKPVGIKELRQIRRAMLGATATTGPLAAIDDMFWVALRIQYQGMLRISELINLTWECVSFGSSETSGKPYVELSLVNTKTRTHSGHVFKVWLGLAEDSGLGVHNELKLRLSACQRAYTTEWRQRRVISFGDTIDSARSRYNAVLKRWCAVAGLVPDGISSHSVRHGSLTDMLNAHVPRELVMLQGRWKSAAFLTYLHPTTAILDYLPRLTLEPGGEAACLGRPDLVALTIRIASEVAAHVARECGTVAGAAAGSSAGSASATLAGATAGAAAARDIAAGTIERINSASALAFQAGAHSGRLAAITALAASARPSNPRS